MLDGSFSSSVSLSELVVEDAADDDIGDLVM